MLPLLLLALPFASPVTAQPVQARAPDVVLRELPNGHVDWTRGVLVVTAVGASNTGAWKDVKVIEQSAFSQLEPRVTELAQRVNFSADTSAADLLDRGDRVAQALAEGLAGWQVVETRYYGSGRVELVAELDLHSWLRPALMVQAAGPDDIPEDLGQVTGLVVDARGLGVQPAVAPRLLGPDLSELYGPQSLSEETASSRRPVVWVADPSHPEATERAGGRPMFLRATALQGGSDLVLTRDDSIRMRTLSANSGLLATGSVVVVVDP